MKAFPAKEMPRSTSRIYRQPNEAAISGTCPRDALRTRSSRFDDYVAKFRERGGIVEERVGVGARKCAARACNCASRRSAKWSCSPRTIKCWAARAGKVISAAFSRPIPAYASAITRDAAKVGDLLRDAGVIGRFALDFVVTRENDAAPWETYAIEINLRKGGTTHPFLTLQFLTGGTYDAGKCDFHCA